MPQPIKIETLCRRYGFELKSADFVDVCEGIIGFPPGNAALAPTKKLIYFDRDLSDANAWSQGVREAMSVKPIYYMSLFKERPLWNPGPRTCCEVPRMKDLGMLDKRARCACGTNPEHYRAVAVVPVDEDGEQ